MYDQLVSEVFQQALAGKMRRTTDKCEVEAGLERRRIAEECGQ